MIDQQMETSSIDAESTDYSDDSDDIDEAEVKNDDTDSPDGNKITTKDGPNRYNHRHPHLGQVLFLRGKILLDGQQKERGKLIPAEVLNRYIFFQQIKNGKWCPRNINGKT